MGIFDKIFNKKPEERSLFGSLSYSSLGANYVSSKAMLLPAVYRCVEVISDSVAQLPLEPFIVDSQGYRQRHFSHPTYNMLHLEPNSKMTTYTFIKTLVASVLLNGNGFAYIQRDSRGNAVGLHYLPPEWVTVNDSTVDHFKPITYSVTGIKGRVEACNMIHILNFSYDGINGVSTLTHAANTLGISADSESHARGFFKGGANAAGILKVQSVLSAKQKADLKTAWSSTFNAGTGEPNGVAVLEGNMDYQPITVNPKDAQMLETREFNVVDVCRFFGVSPVKSMALDTLVPTPDGWNTIGGLETGDLVYDRNGNLTEVLSKTDIFYDDTYKVIFEDGDEAVVGYDHNWVVREAGKAGRGEKVFTTEVLYDRYQKGFKYRIPRQKAVEYNQKELPVDPYLLGFWLGDGCHTNNHIACLKEDYYVLQEFGHNTFNDRGAYIDFGVPGLRKKLIKLGVCGNKHIPEIYKQASTEQRLALIQGLMDSDGTVDKRDGWCYFTQIREELINDFIEVCKSLGFKCKKNKHKGNPYKATDYKGKGREGQGKDYYVVSIAADMPLFRLNRKAAYQKFHKGSKFDSITISKIEKIATVPTQCITVASPDHTFLFGKGYKVTHNCFDFSKSSYSTVESTQLAFLTDTLGPLLRKIEQEFERKLYKPSEKAHIEVRFDTSKLLRADKAALASYYRELFNIGVLSPNEIRRDLDLNAIEGGDNTFLQVNISTLDNIIKTPVPSIQEQVDNNALKEE